MASPPKSSSPKKLRTSDVFFDSLKCPICYEFFTPPVVQCIKGHSICNRWLSNLRTANLCPQCRSIIHLDCRNLVIEEQLSQVTSSCSWAENGWDQVMPLSERLDHEMLWQYQSQKCQFYQVELWKFEGVPNDVYKHLKKEHQVSVYKADNAMKFNWVLPIKTQENFMFVCIKLGDRKYILEHFYDPISDKVAFLVRNVNMVGSDQFTISILDVQNEENMLSYRARASTFIDYGMISEFPNLSKRKWFIIDYDVLKDYSYSINAKQYYCIMVKRETPAQIN